MFEAILLCLTGGVLGLLLVYFGTIWVTNFIDFNVTLSMHNIIAGLFAALVIGVSRNPNLKDDLFRYAILGFALTEAIALFALMIAFLILFV